MRIISWNFLASGLIFVSSSMFQAMGNTVPSLVASVTRVALVAIPALALARAARLSAADDLVSLGGNGVDSTRLEPVAAQARVCATPGLRRQRAGG